MIVIREILLLLVVGSAWSAFPFFKRSLSSIEPSGYNYETKYFTQKVDHLNAGDERTFRQRYLVNADHWKEAGPLFFYTGNEGDITWFCNNTGFMWDIAPQYDALLVFAEHRYYGESLPFGNDSYKDAAHLNYLSSEQALADFAVLIHELKTSDYAASGPAIAFGGSYGGMLAAWFRMKYPNIVHGSLAASAPIWFFTGLTPCNVSFNIITHDFEGANPNCSANIRNSWTAIEKIATESGGLAWLSSTFKLCEPLKSQSNVTTFSEWLQGTWFNLAMVDYPYPANFLEPLPAWPINVTCEKLAVKIDDDDHKLMEAIFSAVSVYYNSTGSAKCLDISESATSSLGDQGWDFQACTEMVMPMCSDGIHDMFQPDSWNITAYTEECEEQFGVKPNPYWIEILYGGKNISAHSNIVFSNGLLDPWSGGGVLHSISDSLVAVILPNGAHHLDLRAATNADPPDLKAAREVEMQHISKWIAEYWDQKIFCN